MVTVASVVSLASRTDEDCISLHKRASEQYGLTVDDLDDYVYVGGDRKGRLAYFQLKYPGEVTPEHSQTCVCGHAIEENCFIRNTQTGPYTHHRHLL